MKMKLWTIQPIEVWELLQQQGFYRGAKEYVYEDFLSSYDWLIGEMEKRLGQRPEQESYPVWAWKHWNGLYVRPDLRFSGHLEKGTRGVRLEIDIPDEQVVLSEFGKWHYVLNYWYLAETDQDWEAFNKEINKRGLNYFRQKPLPDPYYHQKIVDSWQRIFDIEPKNEDERRDLSIQATFWELKLEQVRKVDFFIAR
jgi:small-conductance mechanosensitive channel